MASQNANVPLSEAQANLLIEHTADLSYKVLFQIMFSTGLRLHDAINLKVSSDNTNSGIKVSTIDLTGRERAVVLPKETIERLNEYRVTHGSPDHYFSEHKITQTEATKAFNAAAKEIGLSKSFSLNSLRETAIISFVQKGYTSESICEAIGHTPNSLTSHYKN